MTVHPQPRWSIPPNWAWTTLSQLGEIVGGGTPSTNEPSYWGDEINWITPSDLTGYSSKTIQRGERGITELGVANSSAIVMPAGSVHFSSRAPIGHSVISSQPTATSQGFKSLVPNVGILNSYVYYYLVASRNYARNHASGTTFLELSGKAFGELAIPLPSTAEQRRIVAKIESLISDIDEGIRSMKKSRSKLDEYRQTLLKHAFEGKLTEQWRKENKNGLETPEQLLDRIKRERDTTYEQHLHDWKIARIAWKDRGKRGDMPIKPKRPSTATGVPRDVLSTLPILADSWVWGPLAWMTCGVEYGTAAKSEPSGEVPVLRMGNIRDGVFDWSDLVYSSDEREIKKFSLHDGDVLFNRTNSPELVGKAAVYRNTKRALFAGYLIRINHLRSVVQSDYLSFFLNSTVARQYGRTVKTDGVNQSNISGSKLLSYPFPFCSIEEQCEISRILNKVSSFVEEMEHDIVTQIDLATSLRQAILESAFSGRLVTQDPSDEPASVLLGRIRSEREQATTRRSSRNKRRRQAARQRDDR